MRKTLLMSVCVALALLSVGATIKLFTDFPNAIPVGSDFFVFQRNNDFINSSVSQVKGDWFNNPVFSGNGGIQGVWTAVTFVGDGSQLTGINSAITNAFFNVVTNNTLVTTNVAFINLETNNIFVNTNVAFVNIETNNVFVNTNVAFINVETNNTFVNSNLSIFTSTQYVNYNITTNVDFSVGKGGKLTVTNSTTVFETNNIFVNTNVAFINIETNNIFVNTNVTVENITTNNILVNTNVSFLNITTNNIFVNTNVSFLNVTTNNIFVNTNVAFFNTVTNNIFVNTNVVVENITTNNIFVNTNVAFFNVVTNNIFVNTNVTVLNTVTNNVFVNTNVSFFNVVTNNVFVNTNVAFITYLTNNTFVNTNVSVLNIVTNNTFINTNVAVFNVVTNNIFVNTNVTFLNITTNNVFVNTNLTILNTQYVNYSIITNLITTNITVQTITNNTFYGTNLTIFIPGGETNLNLAPNSLVKTGPGSEYASITNATGVLVNDGSGTTTGITWTNTLVLSELDALSTFLTNTFTFKTNSVLGGDGNGQITNVTIGSGLTFSGNTLSASGTAATPYDTNIISLTFTWGGPSNTVPVDNGYHFYTTTTGFSFTNMAATAGSNLWSTIIVSNQLSTAVTGYTTIPGIRIYGVPSVGASSNAVVLPGGKTCVASFLSLSTLMTNELINAQSN